MTDPTRPDPTRTDPLRTSVDTAHVDPARTDPARTDPLRTSAAVALVDVVKDYAGQRALDRVSLEIAPGEFVALLGPSGSGKTTALRALAGLESIDGGRIMIGGEDVAAVPVNRRDIGMVFQSYSLFPHLTARENVEFGLRMRRVPAAERRERALATLELVELGALADRYAHQLSGGQQQRVALARALVTAPRVLLLDEPLSALDAKVRVQLRDQIRRIQTEIGITTLFVTHDQEEALAVADRIAVMRSGRIEQIGTPEDLYRRPASPFVAEFIGLTNRLNAHLADGVVSVLDGHLDHIGATVADGPVIALVRPEDLVLSDAGTPGTVVGSSFLGSLRRTEVRLGDGAVVSVQHEAWIDKAPGDVVFVSLLGRPVAALPA